MNDELRGKSIFQSKKVSIVIFPLLHPGLSLYINVNLDSIYIYHKFNNNMIIYMYIYKYDYDMVF